MRLTKRVVLLTQFIFINYLAIASVNDSINFVFRANISDSLKIDQCFRIFNNNQFNIKPESLEHYFTLVEAKLKKSKNLNFFYTNQAKFYITNQKNYSKALISINKRIRFSERRKDSLDLRGAYKFLSIDIYANLGLFDEALQALHTVIKYSRPNSFEIVEGFYFLGWLEFNVQKYDDALVHLKKAVEIGELILPRKDLIEFIGWVGNGYSGVKDYKNAIKYRTEALQLCLENNNEIGAIDCHRYLGQFYYLLKNYEKTIFHSSLAYNSVKNNPSVNRQESLIFIGNTLINACIKSHQLKLGKEYVEALINPKLIPCEYGSESRVLLNSLLANFYEATGDKTKTIFYLKDLFRSKDSLDLSKQKVLVNEQILKQNFEKEQANQIHREKQKDIKNKEASKRQQNIILGIMILLIFLAIYLYISIKSGKQKKASLIQIGKQKVEIENQKATLEEKNKEIIESISYAKRLQDAIFPTIESIKEKIPNLFVYYQPKDIVAGDFYWMEETEDAVYIAVADSTGHGVPGALVSIVCSNALDRSIHEFRIKDVGELLDKTRELVLETFGKGDKNVKDGMDISLVCINTKKSESKEVQITWAGANNPLWFIKKSTNHGSSSVNTLTEIKADKQPIGITDNPKKFTTHALKLYQDDLIYLFTDGFADQFGGEKGKKFKYKALQELLIANSNQSIQAQKDHLVKAFDEWKGNLEQIDDVCVLGVRI